MENIFKGIYWSLAAVIFVVAISIWIKIEEIMEKRYKDVLYNEKYVEISDIRN